MPKGDAFTCLLAAVNALYKYTETNDNAMAEHEGETWNPRSDVSGIALSISCFAHRIIIRTRNIELRDSSDCRVADACECTCVRMRTWPKMRPAQLYLASTLMHA